MATPRAGVSSKAKVVESINHALRDLRVKLAMAQQRADQVEALLKTLEE